ncbi:MAG TPA: hypothetical protein VMC07_02970 [Candidatus Omnitrophota bacterium]|nr:hypothetical protein [Candidatus Omnitrophota bacterium]
MDLISSAYPLPNEAARKRVESFLESEAGLNRRYHRDNDKSDASPSELVGIYVSNNLEGEVYLLDNQVKVMNMGPEIHAKIGKAARGEK